MFVVDYLTADSLMPASRLWKEMLMLECDFHLLLCVCPSTAATPTWAVRVVVRRCLWAVRAVCTTAPSSTSCSTPWASTTNKHALTGTATSGSTGKTSLMVWLFSSTWLGVQGGVLVPSYLWQNNSTVVFVHLKRVWAEYSFLSEFAIWCPEMSAGSFLASCFLSFTWTLVTAMIVTQSIHFLFPPKAWSTTSTRSTPWTKELLMTTTLWCNMRSMDYLMFVFYFTQFSFTVYVTCKY